MRKKIPHLAPPRPRPVPPEDLELFRRAVADAKPLTPANRARIERAPKPPPRPLEHEPAETLEDGGSAPFIREPGTPLSFSRAGLQRQVLRDLRRGGRAVEAELDLHGLTVAQARNLLASFLVDSRERGLTRVRVIHGKGLRSGDREGVLKASVAGWLAQWEDVLAFQEAPQREGGSGAVVVLLRTPR